MTDTPAPGSPGTIALDLKKVTSLIATAKRLVEEDRAVDLGALEGKVATLCAAAAALPRDRARPFLPALESLITGLDELEAALRARFAPLFDSPADGAQAPARAARAARAYDVVDGSVPAAPPSGERAPSSD
jgi:hypothetical protein